MRPNYDTWPLARLALPDDWSPDELDCVQITIPHGAGYFEQLSAVLALLTWSKSFDHDDTHQGAATVSRTWFNALNSTPYRISQNSECSDMRLRAQPGKPWIMESSDDGGVTWHVAVDTCCGSIPPPVVQSTDQQVEVPAAIARHVFQPLIQSIIDAIAGGTPKSEWLADQCALFAQFGGGSGVCAALSNVWDAAQALPEPLSDYTDDCVYAAWVNGIAADLGSSCTANPLDCLSAALLNWLDTTSNSLMQSLNDAAAALGGSATWDATSGGGGAGFAVDCTWEKEFDFTTGAHDWVIVDMAEIPCHDCLSEYIAASLTELTSSGFHSPETTVYPPEPGCGPSCCAFVRIQVKTPDLRGSVCTGVWVTLHSDSNDALGPRDVDVYVLNSPYISHQVPNGLPYDDQVIDHKHSVIPRYDLTEFRAGGPSLPTSRLWVLAFVGPFTCIPGDIFFTSIKLFGTGLNPFA